MTAAELRALAAAWEEQAKLKEAQIPENEAAGLPTDGLRRAVPFYRAYAAALLAMAADMEASDARS